MIDNHPINAKSLELYYPIDGKQLQQQYKDHLSGFYNWNQREHAEDWVLFPDNIGSSLSLDETALSNGDLYTILTNKAARGRKGALVAMIKGTDSSTVISILKKMDYERRCGVSEVSLDMSPSMNKIALKCFPKAQCVIDRFHVQRLALDAVQDIRIDYRWKAIAKENQLMQQAKSVGQTYQPEVYNNGDTEKQLLARSKYLLYKTQEKWSESQKRRADILFEAFPKIKQAYDIAAELRRIYSKTKEKTVAYTKLAHWFRKIEEFGDKKFRTVSNSVYSHYKGILNFFNNRTTNASAESFNAKIKAFRASLRGVRDIAFFLFRLTKIYA